MISFSIFFPEVSRFRFCVLRSQQVVGDYFSGLPNQIMMLEHRLEFAAAHTDGPDRLIAGVKDRRGDTA